MREGKYGFEEFVDDLEGWADSYIGDLQSGLDDGTYEEGQEHVDKSLAYDEAKMMVQLKDELDRARQSELLAVDYNEGRIDVMVAGERLREIFNLK